MTTDYFKIENTKIEREDERIIKKNKFDGNLIYGALKSIKVVCSVCLVYRGVYCFKSRL